MVLRCVPTPHHGEQASTVLLPLGGSDPVDAFQCECGGRMRLLAVIQDPRVIRAILDGLHLPSRAPPLAPATREPTELELHFGELPVHDR